MYMISGSKIFLIMLLRQLNLKCIVSLTEFLRLLQGVNLIFWNLKILFTA